MNHHILYIGADPDVKGVLEQGPYTFDSAETGEEGIFRYKHDHHHIVIVEQTLPDCRGLDTCLSLLSTKPGLPIIILVDPGCEDIAADALNMGVMHFIPKRDSEIITLMLAGIVRQIDRWAGVRASHTEVRDEANRYREMIGGIAYHAKLGFWEFDEVAETETYLSPEFSQYLQTIRSKPDHPVTEKMDEERVWGVHPDDWETYLESSEEQIQDQGWWDVEYRADSHLDQTIWLREIGKMIKAPDGSPVRSFGLIQDITELKRVDVIKGEFVSTVSHELRTPLTSIKGSLGLIKNISGDELSEDTASLIDIAHRNCDQLVLLINDLLDIEKFESGDMVISVTPIHLNAFVHEAIEAYQGYGLNRKVSFFVKGDIPSATVHADKMRLLQVMANLMSNAAKFSPENSEVELTTALENGNVLIMVRDHGPGIPHEFHNHIFDKFTQADSSDARRSKGSGLGLNITKKIVEAHGGTIHFETEEGNGTTFIVTLPLPGTHKAV